MKVSRHDKQPPAVVFEGIEPFFLEILRQLPADADPGDHPAARARLFSEPMTEAEDGDEFLDDWKSYVEPEIRDLFLSAREIVVSDLAMLPAGDAPVPAFAAGREDAEAFDPAAFIPTEHSLTIPVNHLEAWLRVLNQARLVIAARRGFDEKSMERERPFPPFTTPRERDMFKINFFDELQQVLMREIGYR